MDEVAAMKALKKDRRLKYVELDMAVAPAATVTDPSYGSSWALPKIQAPAAWDSANGSGVTIAILDTGMDSSHPDLAANLVPGWNMYDNNSNTADVNGHGTWVAGAAAMVANNGNGQRRCGLGREDHAGAHCGRRWLCYWSTVAQGIYWAADNGAKVVNISYNGVSGSSTCSRPRNTCAARAAWWWWLPATAAGWKALPPTTRMLSVAATDQNDVRASFSSYGAYVDLAAPGVEHLHTDRRRRLCQRLGHFLFQPRSWPRRRP